MAVHEVDKVQQVSANYTANPGDLVVANATGGAVVITLPSGMVYGYTTSKPSPTWSVTVSKLDNSANTVTVKTLDGSTIDGVAGTTGRSLSTQFSHVAVVSDGNNWFSIAA
jgi:hypothetical protein